MGKISEDISLGFAIVYVYVADPVLSSLVATGPVLRVLWRFYVVLAGLGKLTSRPDFFIFTGIFSIGIFALSCMCIY